MRLLPLLFLTCLLAASPPAAAQTLAEAVQLLEKKEYVKARDLLEKVVLQGNVQAEVMLADMYMRPTGIPRNTVRGMALYQTAANKGNPEAQFALATEYNKGDIVPQDKKRAMGLWRTSAKLKHPGAQFVLCVEESTDGSKYYDIEEAYAWCETSAGKKHKQSGDAAKRSKEALKKVEAKGGVKAVEAAKARALRYAKAY